MNVLRLRILEIKDKFLMFEWMQDENIVEKMHADFKSKTLDDCDKFIRSSWESSDLGLHLAVVDEKDVYQGTVSLKHVHMDTASAEFAIVMRKCAMGNGSAIFAMRSMLDIGRTRLNLKNIYWCVGMDNLRAVRFYDKNGFQRIAAVPDYMISHYKECRDLLWYEWKG